MSAARALAIARCQPTAALPRAGRLNRLNHHDFLLVGAVGDQRRCRSVSKPPKPAILYKEPPQQILVTPLVNEYQKHFEFPAATPDEEFRLGKTVTIHGFLGRRRDMSKNISFVDIFRPGQERPIQVRSAWMNPEGDKYDVHTKLKAIRLQSAVAVTGKVAELFYKGEGGKAKKKRREMGLEPEPTEATSGSDDFAHLTNSLEPSEPAEEAKLAGTRKPSATDFIIYLEKIQTLNAFPPDIIVSRDVVFKPSVRHLQMRFTEHLKRRLRFRSDVAAFSREFMLKSNMHEFETPLLFKSTPEGAREFIVPTRRRGRAYALPQSPQQFKQMIMAGGVSGGYFQLARCFRDEDLRADRQPEFTQLDIELAFARGEDVMQLVERYIKKLYAFIRQNYDLAGLFQQIIPVTRHEAYTYGHRFRFPVLSDEPFRRITYQKAMEDYGTDKPDLRIPGIIQSVEDAVPEAFVHMISPLPKPTVDAWRLRLAEKSPRQSRDFLRDFFTQLSDTFMKNPDGMPAVVVYDSSEPAKGLSSIGHEGLTNLTTGKYIMFKKAPWDEHIPGPDDDLTAADKVGHLEDGDIIFFQARKKEPLSGSSTIMGQLRLEAYKFAQKQGLLPEFDYTTRFLWVTDFPMFTKRDEEDETADPGQGGHAGFAATHHPFTAPLSTDDFALLELDPLAAKADHYDLVLNGVELGGGSRRIHVAKTQEYIMRNIIKMDDAGVAQFRHLLEALRAGCPPHAGMALGFDRLVAMLSGTNSVRDVIAFPKSMNGDDLTVKSPGRLTREQLDTYHLELKKFEKEEPKEEEETMKTDE